MIKRVTSFECTEGISEWEGLYGSSKYDFEIHAMTGAFLEWRKE